MFAISREKLITNLTKMQKALCCYMGPTCDCKYGFDKIGTAGEQTGCPELREAVEILQIMSEDEFKGLAARAKLILIDDLTRALNG
jgi:hypothetical protein